MSEPNHNELEDYQEVREYVLHCIHQKGLITRYSPNYEFGMRTDLVLDHTYNGLRVATNARVPSTNKTRFVVIPNPYAGKPVTKELVRSKIDTIERRLHEVRGLRAAALKRQQEEAVKREEARKEREDKLRRARDLFRERVHGDTEKPVTMPHLAGSNRALEFIVFGQTPPQFILEGDWKNLSEEQRVQMTIEAHAALSKVAKKYAE